MPIWSKKIYFLQVHALKLAVKNNNKESASDYKLKTL